MKKALTHRGQGRFCAQSDLRWLRPTAALSVAPSQAGGRRGHPLAGQPLNVAPVDTVRLRMAVGLVGAVAAGRECQRTGAASGVVLGCAATAAVVDVDSPGCRSVRADYWQRGWPPMASVQATGGRDQHGVIQRIAGDGVSTSDDPLYAPIRGTSQSSNRRAPQNV